MTDFLKTLPCFPSNIYTIKKMDFVSDLYSLAAEKLAENTYEIDDVYPVKMSGDLRGDYRIEKFCDYIANVAMDILDNQGYNLIGKEIIISSIWCQEHHKYSLMEQHTHPAPTQIVGFYFLSIPDNCPKAIFYDPKSAKTQCSLPQKNDNAFTYASNIINIKPSVGTLLLANSWLPHSFSKNADNTPFMFIHFNIDVVDASRSECCKKEVEII